MDFYYNEELVFQRGSRGNNDQYIEALRRGKLSPPPSWPRVQLEGNKYQYQAW